MTKEARSAKAVRATDAEWAEIDKVRGGVSRQEFMLRSALGVARGELVPKTRGKAKPLKPAAAKTPSLDPQRWNRVKSLAPGSGSTPRPKGTE